MKKIINIIGLAILTLFVVSCEKDTEGISFETNYASFELTGDNPYALPVGTEYTEPGVVALAGADELEVTSSDDIDAGNLGVYTVNYSATNVDGYEAFSSRTVAVYDPSAPDTDFSGTYIPTIVRTEGDGTNPRDYAGSVLITKVAPGVFEVSCLLGGAYSVGAGYGSAYAMHGYISLNADNTLTLLSSFLSGWGDSLADYFDGIYDPATGAISWVSVYAGGDYFTVTLN